MTTFTFRACRVELDRDLLGIVVMFGLLTAKRLDAWTALFLVSTVAASVTGFLFPFHPFLASHGVGITSIYLNVFVLIVQAFQKVPALKAMAPTQSEPPFLLEQLVVLALFVVLGIAAAIRFRVPTVRTA